jgi:hypothetical protein
MFIGMTAAKLKIKPLKIKSGDMEGVFILIQTTQEKAEDVSHQFKQTR